MCALIAERALLAAVASSSSPKKSRTNKLMHDFACEFVAFSNAFNCKLQREMYIVPRSGVLEMVGHERTSELATLAGPHCLRRPISAKNYLLFISLCKQLLYY